ncbi:MAG: class I SAM-dependent methyltransferase [Planctomycetota bacterium]|nr:class I SAM-dependent methyltransferase [Planctomycetota bacterium]
MTTKLNPEMGYTCPTCRMEYPTLCGVLDFLPDSNGAKGLAQKLMEYQRIVEIYEGRWWRRSKLFAWLMGIRFDREMALIKQALYIGSEDRVLDLCCGPGLYARSFAEDCPTRTVFGLDLSWPMLRYGYRKSMQLGIHNITFLHGDAHQLPFKDGSIDAVSCCGALHLFSNIRQVLAELHRVINPGGRFSGALAMRTSKPLNRFKAWGDEKIWGIHYYRQEEFRDLLDAAGFEPTIHHARKIWMIVGGTRRQ